MLCATASKDSVWGIGYNGNAAKQLQKGGRTRTWGHNLLGEALMATRTKIRETEKLAGGKAWEKDESG